MNQEEGSIVRLIGTPFFLSSINRVDRVCAENDNNAIAIVIIIIVVAACFLFSFLLSGCPTM